MNTVDIVRAVDGREETFKHDGITGQKADCHCKPADRPVSANGKCDGISQLLLSYQIENPSDLAPFCKVQLRYRLMDRNTLWQKHIFLFNFFTRLKLQKTKIINFTR